MGNKVKRTERGWPGHFICGDKCVFHLNTLLEYGNQKIVVSTVGNMVLRKDVPPEEIGCDRHFETMVFHAVPQGAYIDMDVKSQISFESEWAIKRTEMNESYVDNLANDMHENVVEEISQRMVSGTIETKKKEDKNE